MVVLPYSSETIVTTLEASEVCNRLARKTATTVEWDVQYKVAADKLFYGYVHDDNFQLALRNMRLMGFTPMMYGKVENVPGGSIVFLQFKLFILTRVLLLFWSSFILIVGTAISVVKKDFIFVLAACVIAILFHLIAWGNFRQQLKPMREALINLLN